MADGDRPIVLVPFATARRAARRAGVTLDLSAEDIALAGKWKHGWIPLDAVASAVKAKRYHGGGGEGRTVKGKGRAGGAVEARREPSRGRTKGTLPTRGRTFSDAGDTTVSRRGHGLPTGGRKAAKANPVGSKLEHSEPKYVTLGVAKVPEGPRREAHISAEPMKDGRHKLTDSKSGESVKASHLASFHSQGHTITGVRNGQMHTRDDYGKAHVYDPATGRAAISGLEGKSAGSMTAAERARAAEVMHGTGSKQHRKALATARAQQVAQDRTRRVEASRGGPKLAHLSEADLQSLISRYGEKSVQADAARAEMLRRSSGTGGSARPPRGLRARYDAETDPAKKAQLAREIGHRKKRPGEKMQWGFVALQHEKRARGGK